MLFYPLKIKSFNWDHLGGPQWPGPGSSQLAQPPPGGEAAFSPALISAICTGWKSVHHSPGSGGAAQPGLAGQGRSVPV